MGLDANFSGADEGLELVSIICLTCKNCAICCHILLSKYNPLTDATGLGYKCLLTLSVTQVACERSDIEACEEQAKDLN